MLAKTIGQAFWRAKAALLKGEFHDPNSLTKMVTLAGGPETVGIDPEEYKSVVRELSIRVLPMQMEQLRSIHFAENIQPTRNAILHTINHMGGFDEAIKAGALTPDERDYLQSLKPNHTLPICGW